MLSLDRFQSCFNSLKRETKSPFTSLTAGRCYVFLLLLPSRKGFIQLSHGSLESCECGAHQNTLVTKALGPAGVGGIVPMRRCVGSRNFSKLQKEACHKSFERVQIRRHFWATWGRNVSKCC